MSYRRPPVKVKGPARDVAIFLHKLIYRLARNWLGVIGAVSFIFVGVAFLAPILMHYGATDAAYSIYRLYSGLCHQLAYRSWFLFGAQPAYPRELAHTSLTPFEVYAARDPAFAHIENLYEWSPALQNAARAFVGNDEMGYKAALCERDVAIYLGIFLATLLFRPVRGRIRPAPMWLYGWLGILPIAIDGLSQLLSPTGALWPPRESTPLFRTVTGILFGVMNGWLAFPVLEESARSLAEEVRGKLERAGVSGFAPGSDRGDV